MSRVSMQESVLQLNYQYLHKEELCNQARHEKFMEKAKLEIDVLKLKKQKLQRDLGVDTSHSMEE